MIGVTPHGPRPLSPPSKIVYIKLPKPVRGLSMLCARTAARESRLVPRVTVVIVNNGTRTRRVSCARLQDETQSATICVNA